MMASFQKHREMVMDLGCILVVGLAVLVFEMFVQPFKRGFFCNDESIHYPEKPNTVSSGLLVVVSFLLPFFVIVLVEGIRLLFDTSPRDSWRSVFSGLLVSVYRFFGVFILGAGLNQLMVDLGKFSIGRLRPHFWEVCKPTGSVCPEGSSPLLYVTDYECSGDSQSVNEARLSFPSGHSALAFYAAVYLAVFLQYRLLPLRITILTHLAQAFVLLLAWYTALSRVSDYAHHPTDVLAGIVIGSSWALLMLTFVTDVRSGSQQVSKEELRTLRLPSVSTGGMNCV